MRQYKVLEKVFTRHYSRLKGRPVPPLTIQFYPYSNLSHTIRVREGRVFVRLSDILSDAPLEVVSAALVILLHRLFKRRTPDDDLEIYRSYAIQEDVSRRVEQVRKQRGRKFLTSPVGRVFNLRSLFNRLNQRYFRGRIKVRHLSWSRRKNRRILGHYDGAHKAIVIDRRLDHPLVPRYVVEYVLYHEMLHAVLKDRVCNGRRQIHHRRFRELEQQFPHYSKAEAFIRSHYVK